jgi:hypothetical protein
LLNSRVFADLSAYEGLDAHHLLQALSRRLAGVPTQGIDGLLFEAEQVLTEVRQVGPAPPPPSGSAAGRRRRLRGLPRTVRDRTVGVLKRAAAFADDTLDALELAGREAVRLAKRGGTVALTTAKGAGKLAADIAASKYARAATEAATGVLLVAAIAVFLVNPPASAPFAAAGAAAVWVNAQQDELARWRQGQQERQDRARQAAAVPGVGGSIADELVRLAALADRGVLTPEEFTRAKQRVLSPSRT